MRLTLHFKRMAFAQVVLGIIAFCMAEQNIGLLLVAGAISALSWYVTEGPNGRPMPRWAVNILSLFAVGWLVHDLVVRQGHVIVAMGHFTMALQVLMLYGPKANRDYAQILVLSLLQMLGASVLSVSMIFGFLLIAYCALGLVTVLLFQLKNTADRVHEANRDAAPKGVHPPPPGTVTGRGYRWHFRLEALAVGLVCALCAVVSFVAMPRTGQTRMGMELAGPIAKREVGFSQTVQLGTPMNALATKEPVMNVRITLHGATVGSQDGASWLLRGAALDRYKRKERRWVRSSDLRTWDSVLELGDGPISLITGTTPGVHLDAQITRRGLDDGTLFSIAPITVVGSDMIDQVRFNPIDQQLQIEGSQSGPVVYRVRWPLGATPGVDRSYLKRFAPRWAKPESFAEGADPGVKHASGWGVQPLRTARLARRVLREAGVDWDETREAPGDPHDAADAFAEFLRTQYTYSTDNPRPDKVDPIAAFLFNHRRGHCELFASAHAALCRSVGIPARVVTGYRASEYNPIGGYYVVRQSHAHAWTEVYLSQAGWHTFDATPAAEVDIEHAPASHWFSGFRQLYDHLEYTWIRSIVAYDRRTRAAVIENISDNIEAHAAERESMLGKAITFITDLPRTWRLDKIGYTAAGVVLVMLVVAIASLTRLLILRRRKLVALQLTAVPRPLRRGLARKLRFYLHMLEVLERHGHVRPAWQSPYQFATDLSRTNAARFDPVVRLTEVFYEVRFGHRQLDPGRRALIRDNLKALERSLSPRRI